MMFLLNAILNLYAYYTCNNIICGKYTVYGVFFIWCNYNNIVVTVWFVAYPYDFYHGLFCQISLCKRKVMLLDCVSQTVIHYSNFYTCCQQNTQITLTNIKKHHTNPWRWYQVHTHPARHYNTPVWKHCAAVLLQSLAWQKCVMLNVFSYN